MRSPEGRLPGIGMSSWEDGKLNDPPGAEGRLLGSCGWDMLEVAMGNCGADGMGMLLGTANGSPPGIEGVYGKMGPEDGSPGLVNSGIPGGAAGSFVGTDGAFGREVGGDGSFVGRFGAPPPP